MPLLHTFAKRTQKSIPFLALAPQKVVDELFQRFRKKLDKNLVIIGSSSLAPDGAILGHCEQQ